MNRKEMRKSSKNKSVFSAFNVHEEYLGKATRKGFRKGCFGSKIKK